MALELRIGDVVRMKKAHPCGNHLWRVTRLGADIGITCRKCRRHVMLPRSYLERRLREVIPREQVAGDEAARLENGAGAGPGQGAHSQATDWMPSCLSLSPSG